MTRVYVGNTPYTITEQDLRTLFAEHGEVARVTIVTDRETGRARGFAFVEFAVEGAAEAAVEALDGSDLGGRRLTVDIARERTGGERSGGGGGGGGDRGRRRDEDHRGADGRRGDGRRDRRG